jgi:hypothetical protein
MSFLLVLIKYLISLAKILQGDGERGRKFKANKNSSEQGASAIGTYEEAVAD